MFKKIALAATLAILSTGAFAADGQMYAGADIGTTKIKDVHDRETGYGVLLGYAITPAMAVEANFRRLASYSFDTGCSPVTPSCPKSVDLNLDQIALSGVGTLPLSNNFSLFGRLGYNRVRASASAGNNSGSASDSGVLYGIGAGYAFSPTLSARIEVQKPSSDATSYNAGIVFKF